MISKSQLAETRIQTRPDTAKCPTPSWKLVKTVLPALCNSSGMLLADSLAWQKLHKTANALVELSSLNRASSIALLRDMLAEHINGLVCYPVRIRNFQSRLACDSDLQAFAFFNNETLLLYLSTSVSDLRTWYVDVECFLDSYTQVRCRLLSESPDHSSRANISVLDSKQIIVDNIIAIELPVNCILEMCFYYAIPTVTAANGE